MNKVWRGFFYLILIIYPFGQLFRLSLTSVLPGLRIQPFEVAIFVFIAFWFFRKLKLKENFKPALFVKEMAIFGLIAFLSLFLKIGQLKASEFIVSFFYLVRYFEFVFFYWSATDFLIAQKLSLKKYLLLLGLAVAILSLEQYLVFPDMRLLLNLGWDEHYFRAIGPFLDPAFTGIVLCLAFLVWLNNLEKGNFLFLVEGIFLLLVIGLTFSRLTYLALFLGVSYFSLAKKKFQFLSLVFLLLAIVLVAPKPGGEGVNLLRTNSLDAKLKNYGQALTIIKKNFWLGVGFNAYRFAQRDHSFLSPKDWQNSNAGAGTDDSFLFVLATTGIFGLSAFLWLWIKIMTYAAAKSPFLLLPSGIVILTSSFFVNCLFYPWVVFWLWLLVAEVTVQKKLSSQAGSDFGPDQCKQS